VLEPQLWQKGILAPDDSWAVGISFLHQIPRHR